jgi:hypothetical protein
MHWSVHWCISPVGTANALVGALVLFSCRKQSDIAYAIVGVSLL